MLSMPNALVSMSRVRWGCNCPKWNDQTLRASGTWHMISQSTQLPHHKQGLPCFSHRRHLVLSSSTNAVFRRIHLSSVTRRTVKAQGFFTQMFGSKKSAEIQVPDGTEDADASEMEALDTGGDIILAETTRDDGSVASIVYRNGGMIDAVAVDDLCVKVNWPRRPVNKLAAALKNSYLVSHIHLRISQSDHQVEEETLIGMARATSDHAFNATIWDVIVDPEYQGRGLGKCLVEQMVRTLLRRDITNISLFADRHVVQFYEQMGFEADPDGIKGMFWCPSN